MTAVAPLPEAARAADRAAEALRGTATLCLVRARRRGAARERRRQAGLPGARLFTAVVQQGRAMRFVATVLPLSKGDLLSSLLNCRSVGRPGAAYHLQ